MASAIAKGYRGIGMEGSIARWYEKNTRKDINQFQELAERLQAGLPVDASILEVAPGPGFLAIEMAKLSKFHVTSLEISKTFVELGRKNAVDAGVPVDIHEGNASAMPFADNSFDFLVCRAAFKNFSEPVQALLEMQRVLRLGGTGVVIDLRRDTPMSAIQTYVDGTGMSRFNRLATMLTFRFMLLKRAYTKEEIELMTRQVPFRKVEVRNIDIGMEIWFEK